MKFFLVIVALISYPLFQTAKKKPQKNVNVTPLVIQKGRFFVYKGDLEKMGKFEELRYKKVYKVTDLFFKDIIQNETIKAKSAVLSNEILKGYNLTYSNSKISLYTSYAVYNTKNSQIKGGKFTLKGEKIDTKGSEFRVYKSKIYAKNILAYIKDVK
ncbi:MAG: hypothetical protein GXO62_01270 [Epsilonproteobacteria bacterium]|nr:hypothetical protein [Campylobacterota bacterium]